MTLSQLFLLLLLHLSLTYAHKNLNMTLQPSQSHESSDFNTSESHPQFANYSCVFSASHESTLKVLIAHGEGYVNGYPLHGDLEITLSTDSHLSYFFDIMKRTGPQPELVFENVGNNEISLQCYIKQGLDYYAGKGTTVDIVDGNSEHYPLQCRVFTIGKNIPLNITSSSGFVWISNQSGEGVVYVNSGDFAYVVEGDSAVHEYKISNNGEWDVDVLCENFFG